MTEEASGEMQTTAVLSTTRTTNVAVSADSSTINQLITQSEMTNPFQTTMDPSSTVNIPFQSTVMTEETTTIETRSSPSASSMSTTSVIDSTNSTMEVTSSFATLRTESSTSDIYTTIADTTQPEITSPIFNQTTTTSNSSFTTPFLGPDGEAQQGLELWHIIVIAVGSALLLAFLISLIYCCVRKRKKNYEMKKKKKLESMWTVGTGGAEVPMINITSNQKPWKGSSDTIDDRITTAVVVEQSTVNVFTESSNGSNLGRALSNVSAHSKSSTASVGKQSSNASSAKLNVKSKKLLTKVEVPLLNNGSTNGDVKQRSTSDLAADDDTSDANSVFTDTQLRTPTSGISGFLAGKSGAHAGEISDDGDLPPPPPPPPSD